MQERIGQLDCLKRPGDSDKLNVVLLHGFGADAGDLYPLADFLDPDGHWTFYFPNAPLEVYGAGGRGWFPISLRELEAGVDFTQIRPPGLDASSDLVGELAFNLHSEKLVLGGFSQGAMVSTDVAMRRPEDVEALLLFSGTLLDEAGWSKRVSGLKGKRFLQSHGNRDPVLPFEFSRRLYEMLEGAGLNGQFVGFDGAHAIPPGVLMKAREFLRTIF